MLARVFAFNQFVVKYGWALAVGLIVATVWLGYVGFKVPRIEGGNEVTDSDRLALYKAISLLGIQTGAVNADGNPALEWARWLGLAVWASAVVTVGVRLFRERVHRLLVKALAGDHVIVAGLGETGGRLVGALRKAGRSVVVIEPDHHHPAVDRCRATGAVVLFGATDDRRALLAANLFSAREVLALFGDEAACVRAATAAYRLLSSRTDKKPVRCVLRLTEPGLLDLIRRHRIKTEPYDRYELEILNAQEIAAAAMVREAQANSTVPVRSLLVLGLGHYHRLGEMVVLRAAKDFLLDPTRRPAERLTVHVFDKDAVEWRQALLSRFPHLELVCDLCPHTCWARKVGATVLRAKCATAGGRADDAAGESADGPPACECDAAFVCIEDDGPATAQAEMLRRQVLTRNQPVMVRVSDTRTGFGRLANTAAADADAHVPLWERVRQWFVPDHAASADPTPTGWGTNLHPIGVDDPLYEPVAATRPERELRARTIHHHRARRPAAPDPADRPWATLAETFRLANRALAERYDRHLALIVGKKTQAYRADYCPDGFGWADAGATVFEFSPEEVDALAEVEHELWLAERTRAGWEFGAVKDLVAKTNPMMVPFDRLTDDQKRYNREFVRCIPLVLALADYRVVAVEPAGR